ncbi:MAG: choice-of-anchor J domain-containing protein [Bacteroidota bacterium]
MISPSVNLSQAITPVLSFRNASGYDGAELELWISYDYDGISLPSTATWYQKQFTLCPQDPFWTWTSSGDVNLSNYKYNSVYVAFKYTGSSADGRTWEIDDIVISEQ